MYILIGLFITFCAIWYWAIHDYWKEMPGHHDFNTE